MTKFQELIFSRDIETDKIYCTKQLVGTFLVSERNWVAGIYKVQPLIFKNLCCSLVKNEAKIAYWRFLRGLYLLGFIDCKEAEAFSWKQFTFDFIYVHRKRKAELNRIKTQNMLKRLPK